MNEHHSSRRLGSTLRALVFLFVCAPAFAAPLTADFDGALPGQGSSPGPLLDLIRENAGFAPAPVLPGAPLAVLNHEGDLDRGDPDRWDGGSVRSLAHELDQAAAQLYQNYRARSDTGNILKKWSRQAAINVLRPFAQEASHFHSQVESRFQDPAHTREDFRRLMRALDQVDQVLPGAYHSDRVQEEYHRVTQLADSLLRYYRWSRGGGGGGGWRYWEAVKSLAHEVDERAAHAYEQMLRDSHHGDYRESRALEDLREFSARARHFHSQIEDRSRNPDSSHTRRDYDGLVWAFKRAHDSLQWAHPTPHVQEDFDAAARAVRELDRYYIGDGDGHDDHGGHDRDHDDHGRDDDHGRRPPRWPW